ncbi:MAG: hypothetical protein R6X06_05335, partial [Gammaproteobacteria bacterium]
MYRIVSIEVAEPVAGNTTRPWYRYVISNIQNTITGYRCGSEREVRRFARDCVAKLNLKYPTSPPRYVN